MWRVNIYVESDSTTPKSIQRKTGYVLECQRKNGDTATMEAFGRKVGTYHAVILQTFAEAMKRLTQNCELHLYSQDTFVLDMAEKNLQVWAQNDFRKANGALLANHFQWRRLWELAQGNIIVKEPGMHQYFAWMQSEMTKLK